MDEHVAGIFERIRVMRTMAFYFARTRDASGEVVALVGVRPHNGVIDIVQIYGPDEADAVRIRRSGLDVHLPDEVVWSTSGPADEVIDAVFDLPDLHVSESTKLDELA